MMPGLVGDITKIKATLRDKCTREDCGAPAYDASGQTSTVARLALYPDKQLGESEKQAVIVACEAAAWAAIDPKVHVEPDIAGFLDPPRLIARQGADTLCAYESIDPDVLDAFVDHLWSNCEAAGIAGRLEAVKAEPAPLDVAFPGFRGQGHWIMAFTGVRFGEGRNHLPTDVREQFAQWWFDNVRGEWLADRSGLPQWLEGDALVKERTSLDQQGETNRAHLGVRRGDNRPIAWVNFPHLQGIGHLHHPTDTRDELLGRYIPLLTQVAEEGLGGCIFPSEEYCSGSPMYFEGVASMEDPSGIFLSFQSPAPYMIGPQHMMSRIVTVAEATGYKSAHPTAATTCLEHERIEAWMHTAQPDDWLRTMQS